VTDGVFQADPWVETSAITRRQEHPFHESSVGFRRERTELGRRIALAFWLERRMIGINFPKLKPEEGKAMTTRDLDQILPPYSWIDRSPNF
jgi:hypothetical protein